MQSRFVVVCLVAVLLMGYMGAGYVIEAAQPGGSEGDLVTGASPRGSADALKAAMEMEKVLSVVAVPQVDLLDRAVRLKYAPADAPRVARTECEILSVGAQMPFWITNQQDRSYSEVMATLRYATPHLYMWVQNDYVVAEADLQRSAERFENQTYPLVRQQFGSEWSPGIDGDLHLNIFNGRVPGVGGYYSSSDEFSKLVNPHSNEKEMFYVNIDSAKPGTETYDAILAHEFQHMIHWNIHRNEDTWVNEGLAQLASDLAECASRSKPLEMFALNPDTQLTDWSDDAELVASHYGASHSFMNYLLKRFGNDFIAAFVADSDSGGMNSLSKTLTAQNSGVTAEDVFADWVVANYFTDPKAAPDPRYGIRLGSTPPALAQTFSTYPAEVSSTVHQYGADYYELNGAGDLAITFEGAPTVKLANNQAHSGVRQWWSNRGDGSEMTLTRAFDLTRVGSASLDFSTWFDIEKGWDFAYVAVSTDGGNTWDTLQGRGNSMMNVHGNSPGWAYTGVSGGGDAPTWIDEHMDLTPYAGKNTLLRFEYVTDDAVNKQGFSIDDIRIPEIGFQDDAESDAGGWEPRGFVRSDNAVPQRYIVQIVELGRQSQVHRFNFPLAPAPAAERAAPPQVESGPAQPIIVRGLGRDVNRVVIVISAIAPITNQVAPYHIALEPLEPSNQ